MPKTIDKVRAGGIIAFITSNGISGGTMDKKDAHAREYMARRCDLLGAVRLPNTTFRANAGTDIAMDIVFLQKREVPRMQGEPLPEWWRQTCYAQTLIQIRTGGNGTTM